MKKRYGAPTLATFGRLEELTLGIGGNAPDVGNLNVICLTGTLLNGTATITIVCTSAPTS